MRDKVISLSLCVAVVVLFCAGCSLMNNNDAVVINVYNWGEYISDGVDGMIDVNAEFTRETGIKVNYMTFQDNESLFAKLVSRSSDYDVIIPSDYMVSKMREKGMLRKLNFNNIPNYALVNEAFKGLAYDETGEYSVPYTWGAVGLFYNKRFVHIPEEEITWDVLWDEQYRDKILMFDNSRDAFALSQIRHGMSVNSTNKADWMWAYEDLYRQRELVQAYVMDQIFDKMSNEEAYLAPYYDGDARYLTERNPNIGFIIPPEGSIKFVDAMCVPVLSAHPNEAELYINFMCSEKISHANMEKTGYSSPLLDVGCERYDKLQTFASLPDEISVLLDELWVKVKMGQSSNRYILLGVLLVFVGVYVVLAVRSGHRTKV